MNLFLHGFDHATIRWDDTIHNSKLKEVDALMKFDTVVANPLFSLDKWGKVENKDGGKTTVSYDPEKTSTTAFGGVYLSRVKATGLYSGYLFANSLLTSLFATTSKKNIYLAPIVNIISYFH